MSADAPPAPPFPPPPPELRAAGIALWEAVGDDDLELRPDELAVLAEACSTRDIIASLVEATATAPAMIEGSRNQQIVHPGLQELRQLLASLLRHLGIPDGDDGDNWDGLSASQRARKAAGKRWNR